MPSLRGVEISIVSDPECQKLPEFPHPDASAVPLPRLDSLRQFHIRPSQQQQGNNAPRPSEDHDPARLSKGGPTASVYIPSVPGSQFWLRYTVHRDHLPVTPGPTHLFFKMFVNGRHIISWGIDTRTSPTGVAVKALYEPGERYQQGAGGEGEGGGTIRNVGIEARYFYFTPAYDNSNAGGRGVADDGGLVEVQTFRARQKVRRAVELEQYKSQAHYGVISPSGGLLDDPQNATFYTWFLEDARDAPYATFRFHYRSWKNLRDLNLVPESYLTQQKLELPWEPSKSGDVRRDSVDSLGFSFGFESEDTSVFGDDKSSFTTVDTSQTQKSRDVSTLSYFLRSPPERLHVEPAPQTLPQPSKTKRDAITASYLQRPLPPLPMDRPQSRSSVASRTPSITPSLLPYLDDSSLDDSEVEIEVASIQTFQKSDSRALLVASASKATLNASLDECASDYETSLAYTTDSLSQPMLSPDTTGSVLDRHIAQFASTEKEVALSLDLSASRYDPFATKNLPSIPRLEALRMGGSDWMRRTPSPVHRELAQANAYRVWSPRPPNRPTRMQGTGWGIENREQPRCQENVPPGGGYVEPTGAYPAWI